MKSEKILITGANGQIGTRLTRELRKIYGKENVIASDINEAPYDNAPFEFLDILNKDRFKKYVENNNITQVYHLAAILSAKGESKPQLTWEVNLNGLLTLLDIGRETQLEKIFYPSTIAVFGNTTLQQNTPQASPLLPETVYGISKVAGELWSNYYFNRYGVDVRSLRYPGIIGYESIPSGGTTDYAVEIFHAAIKGETYQCFLDKDTRLPMMYLPDAIRATIELMQAPIDQIDVRYSYNLAAMSFTPKEIYEVICEYYPNFKMEYKPDFRQKIAEGWTESIDDQQARKDWNWKYNYDLPGMVKDMIDHLK